ncbi:hypothetical protein Tco_0804666 [Tanacetum coccineum]|uniref:Uncharacterized protein n=1 Tax=Tanacetum coccineum TaxID=301880 RepID=A0ABQ5A9H8_9ASTR
MQCFNCKPFRHFTKEYRSAKQVKDYAYHKENVMLCKKKDSGIRLSAKQSEWIHDTYVEHADEELEAHYMYMAKIQMVIPAADEDTRLAYDTKPLEKVHSNDDYNVFTNEQEQFEQHESINDTYVMEKADSNVTYTSSDICNNEEEVDQNTKQHEDKCVLLASLVTNLKLDIDENRKIHKQLKKANTYLTQELRDSKI